MTVPSPNDTAHGDTAALATTGDNTGVTQATSIIQILLSIFLSLLSIAILVVVWFVSLTAYFFLLIPLPSPKRTEHSSLFDENAVCAILRFLQPAHRHYTQPMREIRYYETRA